MLKNLRFTLILFSLLSTITLFNLFAPAVSAGAVEITRAADLQNDGQVAHEKGIPVLLQFTMHGCTFCEAIEEEILQPMLISGDYDNKVIIRNVQIDEEDTLITDFNGSKINYEELYQRYNVTVVPTLVLVDGSGQHMGLDMIGVTTIDFYGTYLDQAIDTAIKKVSTAADEAVNAGSPAS